jgi:hypothetical protein
MTTMPEGLTKTRQQTEIGEGLAVGCLVAGVNAISSTAPLDTALRSAFNSWPWVSRYPAARRTPRLAEILQRSSGRRGSRIARWSSSSGLFVPQLCDDEWDLPAACVQLEEATAVPARRWCELAAAFLKGLDDEFVWLAAPIDPFDGL